VPWKGELKLVPGPGQPTRPPSNPTGAPPEMVRELSGAPPR